MKPTGYAGSINLLFWRYLRLSSPPCTLKTPCHERSQVAPGLGGTGTYKKRTLVSFTLPSILILFQPFLMRPIGPSQGTSVTTGCVPICAPLVRMIDADLAFRLALDVRNGAHPDDRLLLRAMLQVRKRARRKLADGPFWRCRLRAYCAQSKPLMNDEKGKLNR